MLLFEHKQHYQSYNTAQSSKQRKIFAFKEIVFYGLQQTLVGTTQASCWVSDITNPKMYTNPAPGNTVHVEKRKSCCIRVRL